MQKYTIADLITTDLSIYYYYYCCCCCCCCL